MPSVSVTVAGAEAVSESETVAALAERTLGRREDGKTGIREDALLAEETEGLPPPAALVKVAAASPSPVFGGCAAELAEP